jgi:hypothetical protein
VGLHSGVAPIAPGLTIDDILRHADEGIDASKRGIDRVRRNEAPTHGAGPDTGGGAGRLPGEAPGGVRGEVADAAGTARAATGADEVAPKFEPTTSETWEDGTVIQFGRTPFRQLGKGERKPLVSGKDIAAATQREVALADLIASQERITKNGLDKPRDDSAGLPLVVREGGRLYIQDGHHRLAGQLFAGDKTARVRFIDKDPAPIAASEVADPFATVRPFVAHLEPEVQSAALRSAVAQMAEGRPIDVTPTLLAEADYPAAVQRAMANAETVAAADPIAARQADERLQQGEPAEQLAAVRELLADTKERLGERAGELEWDSDLKTQRDAVKAATFCMMRNA